MFAMNTARSTYQVHAGLRGAVVAAADYDDALAGHPLTRRLNRIERVVAAYRGQIEKRLNNGVHVVFETADAALLGACEMQLRCAVLPQFSGNRLALRIGIHQGIVRQRSKDNADNALEIASQLAMLDDGIVVSDVVASALNPCLRKLTRPVESLPAEIVAHQVDWRAEMPLAAFSSESLWPASKGSGSSSPYLLLHYGLKSIELTPEDPVATLGRDPLSDLVLLDNHVSRNHCRIERRSDGIVLTDSSTNGTCITPDDGPEFMVKKSSAVLKGKGLLFMGRPCNGERRGGIRYEAY